MNISIFTCSISRLAGGLLDAVRGLYMSRVFEKYNLFFFSFYDTYTEFDLLGLEKFHIKLYKKTNPFFYSKKIKCDLLSTKTNILHIHGLWRYQHAFMSTWKQFHPNPIICTSHGMLDPYIIKNQFYLKRLLGNILFATKGFNAVDCFHALCLKELEDIRVFGLKQPVAIIPNGVFLPNEYEYEHYQNQQKDTKKHLLYLGRLHHKKGVDLLLNAIALIKKENAIILDNWIIDIVGWDHENCKQSLEKIVSDNFLNKMIVFHGGLFGEDKMKMYATSDAYILPSHGEGLPLTVLEAWSWKLPVIITPQCNLPEGFEAQAAIRVNDNVESIKEGIIKLFALSENELKSMGENGYLLVKNCFTWDASAKKMIQLYQWILGQGEKPEFVYE
jgi:poly(glycerol-phosphate) alpha-glucosyltransferase